MNNIISKEITKRREAVGITQRELAEILGISQTDVADWERGNSYPNIECLGKIADALKTTVDTLLGDFDISVTAYENRYDTEEYYWGFVPNELCYDIMKLKPPIKPYRVLEIGCGEGRDAVFLAKNGYSVTAYDPAETGLAKARALAEQNGVKVNFIKGDVASYRLQENYDIIFSSGVLQYIPAEIRDEFFENIKSYVNDDGIIAANVFVAKPFIPDAPDMEENEKKQKRWRTGELFTHFHDWMFYKNEEVIFDCESVGIPHKHCMDIIVAKKVSKL